MASGRAARGRCRGWRRTRSRTRSGVPQRHCERHRHRTRRCPVRLGMCSRDCEAALFFTAKGERVASIAIACILLRRCNAQTPPRRMRFGAQTDLRRQPCAPQARGSPKDAGRLLRLHRSRPPGGFSHVNLAPGFSLVLFARRTGLEPDAAVVLPFTHHCATPTSHPGVRTFSDRPRRPPPQTVAQLKRVSSSLPRVRAREGLGR